MQAAEKDSKKDKALPRWLGPLVIGGTFLLIFAAERRRPLRERREPSAVRTSRNLTMAMLSAGSVAILQPLLLIPLLRRVESRRLGLLHRLPLSGAARTVLGVLLLDYTLWWWHWMNHRIPFLWRFHLPHHVDLDLDASTAIRFHFGEMSLSVLYRMLQIRLLGAGELSISLWQLLLFPSIFFHNSNLALTEAQDRLLSRLVVTPRMHGIHHSDYQKETDSNWSSILSVWDLLHGTFREDIPQQSIRLGVPAWQNLEDVALERVILMPFAEQRDDWRNENGELQISRGVSSHALAGD